MEFPPDPPYVGIFRLNAPDPPSPLVLPQTDRCRIEIRPGPLAFSISVPITKFTGDSAFATIGIEEKRLPEGVYLLIEVLSQDGAGIPGDPSNRPAGIAEVITAVELAAPNLVVEKAYEGIINRPDAIGLASDGPMVLSARGPTDLTQSAPLISEILLKVQALPPDRRDRFQLASRWFRRGIEARNLIDKFLHWYIALEVYPCEGKQDVPGGLRDYLKAHFFPEEDPGALSTAFNLGRIAGFRADIVHNGKANVPLNETPRISGYLRTLEVLVRASLGEMLGERNADGLKVIFDRERKGP